MSLEAARACLLLRWDKSDFNFDFSELTAAGGGDGGVCSDCRAHLWCSVRMACRRRIAFSVKVEGL